MPVHLFDCVVPWLEYINQINQRNSVLKEHSYVLDAYSIRLYKAYCFEPLDNSILSNVTQLFNCTAVCGRGVWLRVQECLFLLRCL